MKIDKQNGNVGFNEESHEYFNLNDPSIKYTSVTTLIGKFVPPFDEGFWSAYKAFNEVIDKDYWNTAKKELLNRKEYDDQFFKTYNIDRDLFNKAQQNILDDWQQKRLDSSTRGTIIHANLEKSFYDMKENISLEKYGLGGRFSCVKNKTELDLENGVYPEYLLYYSSNDGKINIAGQIDLLVKKGKAFSIIDWKGLPLDTEIPIPSGWTTMKDLKEGDEVFDKEGNVCKVLHKSEVHHNPCYRIKFHNGTSIIADKDHRWLVDVNLPEISFERVLTTKELKDFIKLKPQGSFRIPINKAIQLPEIALTLNKSNNYSDEYIDEVIKSSLRASERQRRAVYAEFCKHCVTHTETGSFINNACYAESFRELLLTLGFPLSYHNDKIEVHISSLTKISKFLPIVSIEETDMVLTQCIEVDSPTSTFLCTKNFIVTHNTNKEIKTKSFYNTKTNSSEKLKYPLNNLDNCNFSTYNLQLSTYAWMVQQLHPDWVCEDLVLVHFDHNDKMTVYHMDYLKKDVENMLYFWGKEKALEEKRSKRKRIEY